MGDGEEAGAGGFLTGVLLHGIADLAQLSRQSLLLAILQSLLRSVFKLMKLGRLDTCIVPKWVPFRISGSYGGPFFVCGSPFFVQCLRFLQ